METNNVIDIMKKFKIYEEAKKECEQKKINISEIDTQQRYEVYRRHIDKKWVEIRNKRDELKKISCKEGEMIWEKNRYMSHVALHF